MLNGEYKEHDKEGNLSAIRQYTNGMETGLQREYYPNGLLRHAYFLDEKGDKQGYEIHWYANGLMMCRDHYVDGKKEGLCENFHPNGVLRVRAHYKKDVLHGEYCHWYDNGAWESHQIYKDGFLEGRQKNFNLQNRIISISEHRDQDFMSLNADAAPQIHLTFDPTGSYLIKKEEYKRGEPNGETHEYDKNGNTIRLSTFMDGKRVADLSYEQLQAISRQAAIDRTAGWKKVPKAKNLMYRGSRDNGLYEERDMEIGTYSRTFYKDGVLGGSEPEGGIERHYDGEGRLRLENQILDGRDTKICKTWQKDGTMSDELSLRLHTEDNGMVYEGDVKQWHPKTGTLAVWRQYRNGKMNGMCAEFREDGSLYRQNPMAMGTLHGWCKEYDENRHIRYMQLILRGKTVQCLELHDAQKQLQKEQEFLASHLDLSPKQAEAQFLRLSAPAAPKVEAKEKVSTAAKKPAAKAKKTASKTTTKKKPTKAPRLA